MNFRDQYKKKTYGFGTVEEGRVLRAEKHEAIRKNERAKNFARNRQLPITPGESNGNAGKKDLRTKLLKWKAEKERKKTEQLKKKPPFKVGIVHHNYYSPPLRDKVTSCHSRLCKEVKKPATPPKRITRATQKRLLAKASAQSVSKAPQKNKKVENKETLEAVKKPYESFAPPDYKFTAPNGLKSIPLFGNVTVIGTPVKNTKCEKSQGTDTTGGSIETVKLRLSVDENDPTLDLSVKEVTETEDAIRNSTLLDSSNSNLPSPGNISAVINEDEVPKDPAYYSPYIVSSRGKSNARKEQQQRRGLGMSPANEIPTKDTVMNTLNISVQDEERTAQYFSFILKKETDRLNELCRKWTDLQSESDISEDAQYQILQAVGQTRLLINKKFERFKRLVLDCETGRGEMLVTCKDLQGFWDMMYMEIANCDQRFEKLEKLRSNDWQEEEEDPITENIVKKKVTKKKKVVPTKKSSIRAFILAAKKKRNNPECIEILEENTSRETENLLSSEQNADSELNENTILNDKPKSENEMVKSSPVASKRLSSRQSLLQKTLLSETRKTNKHSPLTIMKISRMCKTPEVQLNNTITYVNSKQTPAKSILKRMTNFPASESRTKSSQKVNFDDHVTLNEVSIDEHTHNQLDLAARLARIDSYESDGDERSQSTIHAEKRLNFDDDSFLEKESKSQNNYKNLPSLNNDDTEAQKFNIDERFGTLSIINTPAKSLNTPLHENQQPALKTLTEDSEDEDVFERILRNRTVIAKVTPRRSRRSIRDLDKDKENQKENQNSMSSAKRRSRRMSTPNQKHKNGDNNESFNAVEVNVKNKRKSSRKSVKFNADDSIGCTENKSVLPMTPHNRRSKFKSNLSYLEEGKVLISPLSSDMDLISWNTPEVPQRVKRSSRK